MLSFVKQRRAYGGAGLLAQGDRLGSSVNAFAIVETDVAGREEARFNGATESNCRLSVRLHRRDRFGVGITVLECLQSDKENAADDKEPNEDKAGTAAADNSRDLAP